MKLLLLSLAVASDTIALLVVGTAFNAFRWPPPQSITPLWGAPFVTSCAAVVFSGAYLWHHTQAKHSRVSFTFPVGTVCLALACLALVFYYPLAYDRFISEHAAHIRADLDQLVKQREQQ